METKEGLQSESRERKGRGEGNGPLTWPNLLGVSISTRWFSSYLPRIHSAIHNFGPVQLHMAQRAQNANRSLCWLQRLHNVFLRTINHTTQAQAEAKELGQANHDEDEGETQTMA